ncbi:Ubiquitin-conjugating enzyme E2 1 [Fulvia fulva]|uniref:Ubiquitin-conjugating enzyme E2 1 n=1 Tax=Passalora fulva TaxID=5499 RepID=A0A9Q8UR79_PASFU|nr:Ubiquitin-conjugating enzyme E2 1 [Fulvia fulva]KAK4621346.1 Ubiquitin-conjugating enzyme E2 1 [Fulvia fulva]KAK4623293.1 Ubiquitin-conjugating enzyme E2 1 [Fulvia fulva]UJO19478.1 Ubiquitin-conjugating enzyme E2 1 [Fulvia fulva]WPV16787.1 Ubiquitin-conjugating enzyme E2 1 [Fulvia fulva]WPV31653.1 Ubiquitin-conjugating enzyme E2 1 [Fulvia fulva]
MATNRNRRLQKEIQDIVKDTHSGITITAKDGSPDITDFTHLRGHFKGPPDTPYENGAYEIDIQITPEYPFKPPEMRFLTKIWHPNISSQTGAICLDTLRDAWSPVLTLKSALISVQSLLNSPEPKDPQDAEVARMLLTRPEEFKHVAREWAVRYAGAPKPPPGSGKTSAGGSGEGDEAESADKKKLDDKEKRRIERQRSREAYKGYNPLMIDQFVNMGFPVDQVVDAFEFVGIDKNGGENYELEEEYIGDVTSRLFGES